MDCTVTKPRPGRGVVSRCVRAEKHVADHVFELPHAAAERVVAEELGVSRSRVSAQWVGHAWLVRLDGAPLPVMDLIRVRSVPLSGDTASFRCSDCKQVVPSSQGADDDAPDACDACWAKRRKVVECEDEHAITLAAHCGGLEWDEIPDALKPMWRKWARRLRARWGVDEQDRLRALLEEMSQRLNEDTDAHLRLRAELANEREWRTAAPGSRVADVAARAMSRLRRERDDHALTVDASMGVAREAQSVARDALSERDETRERHGTLVNACSGVVEAWERHGLAGLACHMYDLRAALEKTK